MNPFDRRTAQDLAELIVDEVFSFGSRDGDYMEVYRHGGPPPAQQDKNHRIGTRHRSTVQAIISDALERPGDRPPTWVRKKR